MQLHNAIGMLEAIHVTLVIINMFLVSMENIYWVRYNIDASMINVHLQFCQYNISFAKQNDFSPSGNS